MKDQETLQAVALLADPLHRVHCSLNLLFSNRIVTPGIVVGSILLASDQLISAEELAVGASSDFI